MGGNQGGTGFFTASYSGGRVGLCSGGYDAQPYAFSTNDDSCIDNDGNANDNILSYYDQEVLPNPQEVINGNQTGGFMVPLSATDMKSTTLATNANAQIGELCRLNKEDIYSSHYEVPNGQMISDVYEWKSDPASHNGYPIPRIKAASSSSAYANWGAVGAAIYAKQADLTTASATIDTGLANPLATGSSTITVPKVQKDSSNTLLISTPEQLAWFQAALAANAATWKNVSIKLTADLDLTGTTYGGSVNPSAATPAEQFANCLQWTPIKNYAAGTFDGQGHAISNLYISNTTNKQGLFESLNASTVKNLNIDSGCISAQSYVGSIVGFVEASSATATATIQDCTSNVTLSGDRYVGGFVGEASTGNLTIERCANYGDATAFSTATTGSVEAGGIVASAHSNGTLTINDCYNRGNMSGKGGATSTSEGGGAGGIFARGNNGNSGHVVKINRCYSTGTLTAASGIALRSGCRKW